MEQTPQIVRANDSHLDELWLLVQRCRVALDRGGIHQWDDVYPTRQTLDNDIAAGNALVLLDAGVPAAVVVIDEHQDTAYRTVSWSFPEPSLIVHRLCVDPRFQRRGFAGQLMDRVEADAHARQYASIRLDAYSGNPAAVAFYRRRGYREVGHVEFPRRPLPFLLFERAAISPPTHPTRYDDRASTGTSSPV
ncbi:MAG TPA: GNAT family N-acetyltransferase [Gemmatimonadaceae bacterium]